MPKNMENEKEKLRQDILAAVLMGDVKKADRLREKYLSYTEAQNDLEIADYHKNHYWKGDQK